MNIRDFLPKNKFDKSGLSRLSALTDEEIKPIIPDLIEWVQDMNFPVADEVCSIIAVHYNVADDYIIKVLDVSQNDGLWKYFIITGLLPLIKKPSESLKSAVGRIALSPAGGEITEETYITAREYLKNRGV